MAMNKKYQLMDLKSKLPEFEPEDNLWGKIEDELDFNRDLVSAITDLPTFDPDYQLWDSIESGIQKPNSYISLFIKWTAVAASVAILVSLSVLLIKSNSSSKLIVETEMVSEDDFANTASTAIIEKNAIGIIEHICQTNIKACNEPDFKEKVGLYHELESEQQQLEKTMQAIGESPEMVKALIRIENLKSTTIQELITITNS
jgi:hypothetical protein